MKQTIVKYWFKAKEYFREGGMPYLIKRALKYIIFLSKKYKLIRTHPQIIMLQYGKTKLYVEKNNVRLFWNDVELTKNIGLHSAFYYNNRCYDSSILSKADFRIKKVSAQEINIAIKWLEAPVTQFWQVIINGNNLLWNIDMRVNKKIGIQQQMAGLMISSDYTKWFNSYEENTFPHDFDSWKEIYLEDKESSIFGVRGCNGNCTYRPSIFFEIFGEGKPFIQNTDGVQKARILQAQAKKINDDIVYFPGRHKYFSGRIKLVEENEEVDNYITQSQYRRHKYFSGRIKLVENKHQAGNYNIKSKPFNLIAEKESIFIFGDFPELHDRIVSLKGDFEWKMKYIKKSGNANQIIKIGISKYNFFRLHKILEFCYSLIGKEISLSAISLNLFPVNELLNNFVKYLDELRLQLTIDQVQFVLTDKELFDLLIAVSSQADQQNERALLRLLGVISEYAFIGPKTAVIDPFHRCNASCLHCWVHTPKVKHAEEFLNRTLDFELYKKIIDDFSQLMVDKIIFQGDGEPLMYSRIFEMIEYARRKNISVSFFTNGSLLDRAKASKIVELGVDEIYCSLPAGTAKTFSIVNPKQSEDTFYTISENMKYLVMHKKQMGENRPILKMTHVIHTLNYHELMAMAKNDVEIGANVIRFYLIRLDDSNRFLQLKPDEVMVIRESLAEVKEYLKDKDIELLDTTDFQLGHLDEKTGSWSKKVFLDEGCLIGWYFCLLPAKGDLSLCCHLRTVGNVREKPFKEIWNSSEYARWRVQAKYLKDNKNVTFLNGMKLYDEHCEHCDTHQVLRDVKNELTKYNLMKYA